MGVLVPASPSEVLSRETPVLGEPTEAYEAGTRLHHLAEQLHRLVAAVRSTRVQLASNRGIAVERIDSTLYERVQQRAQAALAVSIEGGAAFHLYGEQIEQIHAKARQTEAQVMEQLAIIRVCAAQVRVILLALNDSMQLRWSVGVPLEMPRPVAAGDNPVENTALRASCESQWRVAALRWRSALDEIQLLQRQWQSLFDDRVQVERCLVRVLEHMSEDEAYFLTEAAGAPAIALAGISATNGTVTRFGGVPASGGRRSHPLLVSLYESHALQLVTTGKPPSAEAVAQWWWRLNEHQRQQLIDEVPLVVGNLAGVPLESRIAANAVSARQFASADGISPQEASYWNRVATGQVRLVVSDPNNSRIVEMLGEPGPNTARVVIFLPGTMSQMKHFYSGGTQQVSEYLVTRSNGTSVAFVYKDGSWVSWLGPGSNTNYDSLQELGEQVAEFQREVLDGEPSLRSTPRIAIAHSAGMSVLSGAEIAGAEFDAVVSLGGAFALREWRPHPGTEYHHFQYDNDAINMIDGGRLWTPHEMEGVFEQHVFDAEGLARMESHGRIAEGPETNEEALKQLRKVIES